MNSHTMSIAYGTGVGTSEMEGVQGGDGLGNQNGPCPHRQDPLFHERIKSSEVGKFN